jgi:hypothetical protein
VRALDRLKPRTRDLVWTARLLRSAPGLLVPTSEVVRGQRSSGRVLDLRSTIALIFSAALAPYEKPWFAFRYVEEALVSAHRVARAGSRAGLLRSGGA